MSDDTGLQQPLLSPELAARLLQEHVTRVEERLGTVEDPDGSVRELLARAIESARSGGSPVMADEMQAYLDAHPTGPLDALWVGAAKEQLMLRQPSCPGGGQFDDC